MDDKERLCQLVFWNTVATFMTFGLYRFWARNRLRRHFWHRVIVEGAPGEYMGRGMELFGGFAAVFGVMAVVFFAYFVGTIFFVAKDGNPAFLSVAPYLIILFLLPLARFRARHYRLSRTVWRGIGLGQDGSSWVFHGMWFFWLAVVILTFGLAMPWRDMALERYHIRHTRLGDGHFDLDVKGHDLFAAWMPGWAGVSLFMASCAGLVIWWSIHAQAGSVPAGVNLSPVGAPWSDIYAVSPAVWILLMLLTAPVALAGYVDYRTRQYRYVVSRLRFGEARFKASLSVRAVMAAVLPFALGAFGYLALSFGLVLVLARMLGGLAVSDGGGVITALTLLTGLACLGILFVASYGMSLLYNLTMRTRLLTLIAAGLTIENAEALTKVGQRPEGRPEFGEGLVDIIDVGNF